MDTNEIHAALAPYYEEDDLIMNEEYKVDEASRILSFRVDLLKDEYDVRINVPGDSHGDYVVSFGGNSKTLTNPEGVSLGRMLTRIMEYFAMERDAGLDSDLISPTTPSGVVDWDNLANSGENAFDTIDEGTLHAEDESIFGRHSAVANILFGADASTSIKNAHTIRITVSGSHMETAPKQFYALVDATNDGGDSSKVTERDTVTLSLKFAEDYVNNPQAPDISSKTQQQSAQTSVPPAFGEQVLNMARVFLLKRWQELSKNPIPPLGDSDEKLRYLHQYIADETRNSTIDSIIQQAIFKRIKYLVEQKNPRYAMAIALWSKQMDTREAVKVYIQAGGEISEANRELLSKLLYNDNHTNFVLEMLTYLTLRIYKATEVCAICDRLIEVGDISHKAQVCTSFKCQFDYISLGVCASIPMTICPTIISHDIMDNADICDILINMCYSASKSDRRDLIFDPFPPFYVGKNQTKEYDQVIKTLDALPGIASMLKHCDSEMSLKRLLGSEGYELVKWILTTKRTAMFKMSKDKNIKELQTEHQYMMLVDDPDIAKKFTENRKKYGSYMVFHGTAFENLHSVTRRRLVVASGTSLQTTGMAYGAGIYLSESFSTSLGYSRPGVTWPKSKFGQKSNMKVMFICEVVKLEGVPTVPNPYYVVNNAEAVSVRFFLFYPDDVSLNVVSHDLGLEKYLNYGK